LIFNKKAFLFLSFYVLINSQKQQTKALIGDSHKNCPKVLFPYSPPPPTINVTQAGTNPTLLLNRTTWNPSSASSFITVNVTADGVWNMPTSNSIVLSIQNDVKLPAEWIYNSWNNYEAKFS